MALAANDLGVVGNLAEALGLTSSGDFRADWLSDPGKHLSRMLAEDRQRAALIAFIDEVLAGEDRTTGPDGKVWLPIARAQPPLARVYLVIDERPTDWVGIGVGVKVSSDNPAASVSAQVPLFRAAKAGRSVSSPLLLGTADGTVTVEVDITTTPAAPAPGAAHLGGVALALTIPTDGGVPPRFALKLRRLQMPGAAAPADLSLSVADLASLRASALDLVLGLVRAQAAALPAGPLAALAGLLGLRQGSAVTPLPLAELARDGVPALSRWLGGVLGSSARAAWLAELSTLLTGNTTHTDGTRVTLPIGPLQLTLEVPTTPGANGLVRVEPTVAIVWPAQAGVHLRAQAVLCRLDLGSGQALALPSLSLHLALGLAAGGTALLDVAGPPALHVDSLRAGIALNGARQPVLLLAAEGVRIAGHAHGTLDLSSPQALAQVGATVFSDMADAVFTLLGPAAAALRLLLGVAPPAVPPGIVPIDVGRLLQDPLDALRGYWRALLRDHPAAVPTLLAQLRDLIADDAASQVNVSGTGQIGQPWRFTLAGPVAIEAHVDGDHFVIGPAMRFVVDTIGQRCTRLETNIALRLVDINFAQPSARFLTAVDASLQLRARGRDEAVIPIGPALLSADFVAVVAAWSPTAGLKVDVQAPGLALSGVAGLDALPVPVPRLDASGRIVLDAAGWAALEELLAALAQAAAPPWLDDLVALLGWVRRESGAPGEQGGRVGPPGARLRLQHFATDARGALQAWLRDAIQADAQVLQRGLNLLSNLLTGTRDGVSGLLQGRGHPDDPWRLPIARGAASAELLAWLGPQGPPRSITAVADLLLASSANGAARSSAELARVLGQLSGFAVDVADLLAGRDAVAVGFDALQARWEGSDGCVVPPQDPPAGVQVRRLPDVAQRDLVYAVDLEDLLDAAPPTVVHVSVVSAGSGANAATAPWVDVPASRAVDLTAPGLAPSAFVLPLPAVGDWFVCLGGRDACRRPTGDVDGVLGQADRLEHLLASLPGPLVIVADAAAGHAARRAAENVVAVTALVTAGTALSPVSMATLDTAPGADALRLLARLLPPPDTDALESADLHLLRGLVDALQRESASDDPARELRPPSTPLASPRVGLAVHMLYGDVSAEAIRRALTAGVAAAVRLRSAERGTPPPPADALPDRLVLALRAGLAPAAGSGSLRVDGQVDMVLAELRLTGVPLAPFCLVTPRDLRVHLGIGRAGGWLVGGPDPGRGAGAPRPHELRRIGLDLRVPLHSAAAPADAWITLHDARVFDITRERWRLMALDMADPSAAVQALAAQGFDAATTLLPEARVLLASFAQELAAQADAASAGLAATLRALGLMDGAGGSVPAAIEQLLHDPLDHLRTALATPAARSELALGLRALWPNAPALPGSPPDELALALGPLTARLRLAPWQVDIAAQAEAGAGGFGWVGWQGRLRFDTNGITDAGLSVGASATTAVTGALRLELDRALRLSVGWQRPGAALPDAVELWPNPDAAAVERALVQLLPAELLRQALQGLRALDDSARPVIDAMLSLVGLLGAANAQGERAVRLPAALLANPAAWLRHEAALGVSAAASAFDPNRLVQLFDALKPLVSLPGDAGAWRLTPGVVLKASSVSAGARIALELDSTQFTAPNGALARLAFGGSLQLTLSGSAVARPGVELFVGLAGGAAGRSAVHVVVGDQLTLFLRPTAGSDIALFPNPAGLGQLAAAAAQQAVTQALPMVLDALAGLSTAASPQREVGVLVTQLGDAMGLRSAGHFQSAALADWGRDPAAQLAARLPVLATAALNSLAQALHGVLPPGASATLVGNAVRLVAGGFRIDVTPSPFAVVVDGTLASLPVLRQAHARIALDGAGLTELTVDLGPAELDVGGALLRPAFSVSGGRAPTAGRRAALTLGLPANRLVGVRWLIGSRVDLVLIDTGIEHLDAEKVALGLLEAVLDMVASFVMGTGAVTALLTKRVGANAQNTVRKMLAGVLLQDNAPLPPALVAQPFEPALLLGRLQQLALNVAQAAPTITIDSALSIGLAAADVVGGGGAKRVGLRLALPKPAVLISQDLTISLETDARWIRLPGGGGSPPDGLVIDMLRVGPAVGQFAFEPALSVNGVGMRFARNEKPLLALDALTLGSIALHVYAKVAADGKAGGAQLQLSGLSVALAGAGAKEGGNGVAQGLLGDAGKGKDKLAPTFSPALAVQKHGALPVAVSLRAGDGGGPWWVGIQRGFGPIYIEQVGFGVAEKNNAVEKISLLLDGRVSLFGLNAAVDDLQLTHTIRSDASVFDPSRWAVDLAGLAFNADMAGLTLQGGLRKYSDGNGTQYVGMLMGRFAVYGLSVFGGYGQGRVGNETFASFFAFGAVNGPIGGPPAFFLTGVGGGLGINRELKLPDDMARFDQYPLVKALDPSAKPSDDPMTELIRLGGFFPMKRGSFWFAAGLSFTSFALVDGVAVVSIQVGDGLEVALMGLARMALPRPQAPLVSIELGLVARFSSKEGVLWVQAQLTDNSWLLYPDVRLTGGFAFVIWFAGPNAGQFVLTIGGYHPKFKRDGYPVVPRLGLQWRVGPFLTIKGESYFALTSEALMAGMRVEVSARFGPAWAQVIFGADGIVFFDPFHFRVDAYAQISAGVTIDVWIGEITISVSLTASIMVEGPQFHGLARFSVGPVDLEVEFGDTTQQPRPPLTWDAFVTKYLELAAPQTARALAAITGKGSVTPGTGPGGPTDTGTADGSAAHPFEVFAEFEITLTSTVPVRRIHIGSTRTIDRTPSHALGVAPMQEANVDTALRLTIRRADSGAASLDKLVAKESLSPSFPYGVWGPPQDPAHPKVPEGKVIVAMDGLSLTAVADIPPGTAPIDYKRVETAVATAAHPRTRHPLPFVSESGARVVQLTAMRGLAGLLPVAADDNAVLGIAALWSRRAGGSRTAQAALRGLRAAPPRLGSLSEGLADLAPATTPVTLVKARDPLPVNTGVLRPRAVGVLSMGLDETEHVVARTTVTLGQLEENIPKVDDPPLLDAVRARLNPAIPAVLTLVTGTRGASDGRTVVASDRVPLSRIARSPLAAVRGRGATRDVQARLSRLNGMLDIKPGVRAAIPAGYSIQSGEAAVFEMPNAARDLDDTAPRPSLHVFAGTARVVMLGHGGTLLADVETGVPGTPHGGGMVTVPRGTHRIAVAASVPAARQRAGLDGWHSGAMLPMMGHQCALAAQAVVQCEGRLRGVRQRGLAREAGWMRAAELVEGTAIVRTRFARRLTVLAVVLDDPTGANLGAGGDKGAGRGLSLSITGATRPLDEQGEPRAPVLVVRGQRVALVYELRPDVAANGVPVGSGVSVGVASEDGWHLVGVVAPVDGVSVDAFAALLAQDTLDVLVRGPIATGQADTGLGAAGANARQGAVLAAWVDARPAPPPSPPPAPPRNVAKAAKATKVSKVSKVSAVAEPAEAAKSTKAPAAPRRRTPRSKPTPE